MTQAAVMTKTRPTLRALTTSVVAFLDDRMNPIVVKELRQAVQSKFVLIVLILFLVIQLFTIGIFLLASEDIGSDFEAGRNVFMVLQGVLLAVCLLFVPAYGGVRLGAERSATNVDLLFITTIKPSSIIWGKFLAGLVVTCLIYSACAPFMVLTYLLRGIDMPTIFVILGMNLLVIVVALQVALLVAAIPTSLVLKILLAIITFALICAGYGMAMGGASSMIYFGVGASLDSWEFWGPALSIVMLCAVVTGLMLYMSVAMISPPSSNRALPVRMYLLVAWAVTGGVFTLIAWRLTQWDYVVVWSATSAVLYIIMLFEVVCERDTWGHRVLRHVPRRWWLRAPMFLMSTGSASGVIGCCLVIAANAWFFYLAIDATGGGAWGSWETTRMIVTLALYALAYNLTAVLIVRYVLRARPLVTFAITLLLMTAGSLTPPLVMFFLDPSGWDRGSQTWLLANPFGTFVEDRSSFREKAFFLTLVWSAIVAPLCLPWMIKQFRGFKPPVPA